MRISQAVGIAAIILIQLLVGGCKPLVQWELKEHLGSKPYADTLQTAEKENWQALDAIKTPQILVHIPVLRPKHSDSADRLRSPRAMAWFTWLRRFTKSAKDAELKLWRALEKTVSLLHPESSLIGPKNSLFGF